ncbi:MAG: ATP-dependent DNA ligase [Actinomycetota bacterium]|nr:ATP-dependent DNA ligase [Actinomycetota bacterium]
MTWPFPPPIKPMLARAKETPPQPPGWVYEPKWDGFRAIVWSGDQPGNQLRIDSRTGKDLLRYFPELVSAVEQLPAGTVVDAEIVVVIDDVTEFEVLQQRIHPAASRVNMLAEQTPAEMVVFDVLAVDGEDVRPEPQHQRRRRLEGLGDTLGNPWHLTPLTDDLAVATEWFTEYEAAGCDGIIAKAADGAYIENKRDWIKWKHRREADCVVGGYRVHKDGDKIGSILLGLFDDTGSFHFVGHCSGFSDHNRVELLARFEALRTDASFGGDDMARVPGAQSRWSTGKELEWVPVEPGVVVQVGYDQLEGNRFRHATRFERWRPDKPAAECTLDQLERPEGAGFTDVVG